QGGGLTSGKTVPEGQPQVVEGDASVPGRQDVEQQPAGTAGPPANWPGQERQAGQRGAAGEVGEIAPGSPQPLQVADPAQQREPAAAAGTPHFTALRPGAATPSGRAATAADPGPLKSSPGSPGRTGAESSRVSRQSAPGPSPSSPGHPRRAGGPRAPPAPDRRRGSGDGRRIVASPPGGYRGTADRLRSAPGGRCPRRHRPRIPSAKRDRLIRRPALRTRAAPGGNETARRPGCSAPRPRARSRGTVRPISSGCRHRRAPSSRSARGAGRAAAFYH